MYQSRAKHFIIAALIFLNGCAAYYPQVVDIPLIKEKGDIRIDAGGFIAHDLRESGDVGGHATVSAGLTNILAIQGYMSADVLGRAHVQGALGLFKGFENKTVIEMYSGYGWGASSWENEKNKYQLVFSQFNIGKADLPADIDYGLGLKGGYIFSNYEISTESQTIHQKSGWIIEPSVFVRVGGRRVKYCTKVNYLWTKTISNEYYFPLMVSMGVNINF